MTSYKGQTITYDEIGNPLTYRDGMTMTWQNGRQLASLQKGNNNIQYSYDSEGIRVSKTINGEKCTFEYLNGMLLYETRGEKYFHYYYDSNGMLCAVSYRLTPSDDENIYYYTHNWRGDIVGIYTDAGDLTAKYTYDSWGNVTSITDGDGNAITSSTHIGNLNPFRYRGYYMDTETGMYYLMSRYYDPVTHRFLNADGYFQTGLGILDGNMNAYCGNNPINCADFNGDCSEHLGWYKSNCFECNPEFLEYERNHIDRYNKLNGTDYIGITDNGEYIPRCYAQYSQITIDDYYTNLNDIAFTIMGECAKTPFQAVGTSVLSCSVTTPVNIYNYTSNPFLKAEQKVSLCVLEIAAVSATAFISYAVINWWNPTGWVALAVSVGSLLLSQYTAYTISQQAFAWENENKRSMGIVI